MKPDSQAKVLLELESDTELEMCDLHLKDWICVLMPGYGFGWVRQPDVTGTTDGILDAPVSSSLPKLSLGGDFALEDTLLLLSAVGDTIETLALGKHNSSATIFDELPLRCPNLTSLNLRPEEEEQLDQASLERFFARTTTDGALDALTIGWVGCNLAVLFNIFTNWTEKEAVKPVRKAAVDKDPTSQILGASDGSG